MYLDALDPVRTSESIHDKEVCSEFSAQGQSMLFKELLGGNRPTLTQTQVMDSKVIHDILKDTTMKDHFLSLIDNGHINIAIYKNLKDKKIQGLQSYFLKTLEKGLKNGEAFHNYSTLPFLQYLDDETRRKFHRQVIEAVSNHSYNFNNNDVGKDNVDYMKEYLMNLQELDWALQGRFTEMGAFTKEFDTLFKQNYYILKNNRPKHDEVVALCNEMIARHNFQNTRSKYYHFLERTGSNYSPESKKLVKGLVDMCYNESVASTIPNSNYNFNIEKGSEDLIKCIEHKEEALSKEDVLLISKKQTKYFTWESLSHMLLEVDRLQKEKNLTRTEALELYNGKTSIKQPAIKLAKYVTLGLGPSLIPLGEGIVQIISTGLNLIASDFINEKFERPSLGDSINEFRNYQGKKELTKKAINFTSVTK